MFFINNIKRLLSGKRSSYIIVLFCCFVKSILILFYTYTGRDKMYHLSAVYNLLHGKGWTNSFYYVENVNREVLQPFCFWPAGYGISITPFQLLFGNNFFWSTSLLEVLCFIAFILLCRSILKLRGMNAMWLSISTIVLGLAPYDFIEASLGTDLPGLCFLLGFFYFVLKIWNSSEANKRKLIFMGTGAGICLFMSALIRFMYMPVGLLALLACLLITFMQKKKTALPGIFTALVVGVSGILFSVFAQTIHCGTPFYIGAEQQRGIYFSNFGYWHPVILFSFINLNVLGSIGQKFTGIPYAEFFNVFSWFNIIIYVGFFFMALVFIKKYLWRWRQTESFPFFSFFGFIISASIVGELAYLSLTTAPQVFPGGTKWTFLAEGRYFAFVIIFIQLFFLSTVGSSDFKINYNKPVRFLFYGLFCLMLFNSAHQLYFTAKVAISFSDMKKNSVREQDYVAFEQLLKKSIEQNPDKQILVAASDAYFPLIASVYKQKGLADPLSLNATLPLVNMPSLLITVIGDFERNDYAGYLNRNETRLVGKATNKSFYMQLLQPAH
ncbi:MAG: hypothetical protein QM764_01940 [Chitinophagaceae bacterium]